MTFYAQWEENSGSVSAMSEEENPNTYDGILGSIFLGILSLIGAITYLRKATFRHK